MPMQYPTDGRFDTASYKEFAEGPWLTRRGMQWFWDSYLPNVEGREAVTASPLRATLEQLHGLPETAPVRAAIQQANHLLRGALHT